MGLRCKKCLGESRWRGGGLECFFLSSPESSMGLSGLACVHGLHGLCGTSNMDTRGMELSRSQPVDAVAQEQDTLDHKGVPAGRH